VLAEFWKTVGKLYAVVILVYFAAAGIRALSIDDFSDWASYMGSHAIYAVAWPIALPIDIISSRPDSPARLFR
jgi:hypothetical protein